MADSPPSTETVMALLERIEVDIADIKKDKASSKEVQLLHEDIEGFKKCYTTKDDFRPVRNIVYGLIALILVAVGTALIALVIKGGQ